ncbi:hypothetical protein ABKN59_009377 [Abortiporus biennis]
MNLILSLLDSPSPRPIFNEISLQGGLLFGSWFIETVLFREILVFMGLVVSCLECLAACVIAVCVGLGDFIGLLLECFVGVVAACFTGIAMCFLSLTLCC